MDPLRVDWGLLLTTILTGDVGRDRARAMWDACTEVLEHPKAYHPVGCEPMPWILSKVKPADLVAFRERAEDEKNSHARNVVNAFSAWRTHVSEVEATNAGRLHMLASTLRTLADLSGMSPARPEIVHARIADLGRFIENTWHVAIPLAGDVRTWAVKVTRRYDLLPICYREV